MPTTEDRYELYHYIPSIAAAAVAIIIFAILTILHGYRMVKRRMWFCLPFVVGGMCTSIFHTIRSSLCLEVPERCITDHVCLLQLSS